MPYTLTDRLEKEAAKVRERIDSIEVSGMRWLVLGKQGQKSDMTQTILAEAKERLSDIEGRLNRSLGKDDR